MNYVVLFHILNIVLTIFIAYLTVGDTLEENSSSIYFFTTLYALSMIYAGYLQFTKSKMFRAFLWIGLLNLSLYLLSGIFNQFGRDQNPLSTIGAPEDDFSILFWGFNVWYLQGFKDDDSLYAFVVNFVPVLLSFIFPLLGYYFAKNKQFRDKPSSGTS